MSENQITGFGTTLMYEPSPAGLELHRLVVVEADAIDGMEDATLPLAHGPDLLELLAADVGFADDGLVGIGLEVLRDLLAVHLADAFDRLGDGLQQGVIHRAAPIIGIDPRHL